MTLFEYLSVAVSLVLSLSVARILDNLRSILDSETRSGIHVGWVAIALATHILVWWEFWAFRDATNWNLVTFVLVLTNPGLLYFSSNALTVRDDGDSGSWQEHFFARRGAFFAPFAFILPVSLVRDFAVVGTRFSLPRHLPEIAFTILFLVAWRAESRRTHVVLLVLTTAVFASSMVLAWLEPGGGSRVR